MLSDQNGTKSRSPNLFFFFFTFASCRCLRLIFPFFYFIVQEKVSKPNGKDGQVPGFKQQQQKKTFKSGRKNCVTIQILSSLSHSIHPTVNIHTHTHTGLRKQWGIGDKTLTHTVYIYTHTHTHTHKHLQMRMFWPYTALDATLVFLPPSFLFILTLLILRKKKKKKNKNVGQENWPRRLTERPVPGPNEPVKKSYRIQRSIYSVQTPMKMQRQKL